MSDIQGRFGRRLQAVRKEKGKTIEQIAGRIGKSEDYVENVEGGKGDAVDLDEINAFTRALDLASPGYLFR